MKKMQIAVQSSILFLENALKRKKLPPSFVATEKKKCLDLLTESDPQIIAHKLNDIISEINLALPENHAPYPLLDFSSPIFQVKQEALAFSHYLIAKLDDGSLTKDIQVPLFKKTTAIWGKVGNALSPEEGSHDLAQLIKFTNNLLKEDESYPY